MLPKKSGRCRTQPIGSRLRTFPGEPVHRDADQENANPSDYAANNLWIGGAERPSEILAGEVAENPNRF